VVQLRVHRDPAVGQALDDVGLPQRTLAGEHLAVQARDELEELADPAGFRQCAVPHVVLDVELGVLGPDPLAQAPQRAYRLLEEQRGDLLGVQAGLVELAGEVGSGIGRLLEELEAGDVHRLVPVLGEQESERGRIDRDSHVTPPERPGERPSVILAARGAFGNRYAPADLFVGHRAASAGEERTREERVEMWCAGLPR
jgi:hypothetical protein